MDFTIEKYKELLEALKKHRCFSLRHDVDLRPEFSLRIAQVEAEMGMPATYYFRTVPESYDERIIKEIVSLGHRAGYHYESLATCKGDMEAAYEDFCKNLEKLRQVVPVTTACAHGSPRSPWNSQGLWEASRLQDFETSRLQDFENSRLQDFKTSRLQDFKTSRLQDFETSRLQDFETSRLQDFETSRHQDVHSLGIEYEPMLDTDFSKTLYITDTGRKWDGYKVSVRDKVPQYQEQWEREGLVFHTTDDIIRALLNPEHPIHQKELLINTHPQRWMPFGMGWVKEAVLQSSKNIVKRIIINLNQN